MRELSASTLALQPEQAFIGCRLSFVREFLVSHLWKRLGNRFSFPIRPVESGALPKSFLRLTRAARIVV